MKNKEIQGYLYGIMTALCWATSPIFIARGLEGIPSSIWATTIGLTVATLIYLVYFLLQNKRRELLKINKKHLMWQMAAGIAGGMGILSRNIALESTQVAVVIGLVQLQILISLILGPIIQGKADRERISAKLLAGVVLILGGTMLIIYGRNL